MQTEGLDCQSPTNGLSMGFKPWTGKKTNPKIRWWSVHSMITYTWIELNMQKHLSMVGDTLHGTYPGCTYTQYRMGIILSKYGCWAFFLIEAWGSLSIYCPLSHDANHGFLPSQPSSSMIPMPFNNMHDKTINYLITHLAWSTWLAWNQKCHGNPWGLITNWFWPMCWR